MMAVTKFFAIAFTFVISIIDFTFFVLAFFIWNEGSHDVEKEIFQFTFGSSPFDLVLLSLFRLCVWIGVNLAVMRSPVRAIRNLSKCSVYIIYISCFTALYDVLKIVFFTESTGNHIPSRIWAMLVGTIFSIPLTYLCWRVLSSSTPTATTTPLLVDPDYHDQSSEEDEDEEEEEEEDGGCKMNSTDKKEARRLTTASILLYLLKMAKADACYLLVALLFLLIAAISEAFLPFYLGNILNYITMERDMGKFKESMLYFSLFVLVTGLSKGIRASISDYTFGRFTLRLQEKLFANIMCMEIDFFNARQTGEITSRLTSDCTKIGDGLSNLNIFLRSIVQIAVIIVFMVKLSWQLTIITLIMLPIIALITSIFGNKYERISESIQSSLAHANASANEAISSVRTVRSFAAEDDEINRYSKRLGKVLHLRKKRSFIEFWYECCIEFTDLIIFALVLYFGGHLVLMKDLTGGHLISFVFYSWDMQGALESIGDVYIGVMDIVGSSRNVCWYLMRKPVIDYRKGRFIPENGTIGQMEFKNVSFSYPSRKDRFVLKNIDFTVNSGEMVALVGASGGGKSSILNLLQHFYEPIEGQILLDGIEVRDYDHHFLHQTMSIVSQEPVVFARKISENIMYGLQSHVADSDIVVAAKAAYAHDFISALPEKYKTESGEKGVQLSGGEKQRLAIARSLVRNPRILLLDEATSALDSESEHIVQQAISKNTFGRTVIVIAHRLSTVENADKILVIDKGEIVEQGTHRDLIEMDSLYASLVKRQALAVIEKGNLDYVDKIAPESNSSDDNE